MEKMVLFVRDEKKKKKVGKKIGECHATTVTIETIPRPVFLLFGLDDF